MPMSRTPIRRTKIVATLGPAWDQPAQMTALLDAGVNVVRINASHGTPEIRARWIAGSAACLPSAATRSAVLLDLQGPRIRVGALEAPVRLVPGETVTFAPEDEAVPGEIPTTYEGLASDVRVGARILLDDGLLALEVVGVMGQRVRARVEYGGELRAHKGMNLPGIEVSAPALTEKDLEDVGQAIEAGVDYIALSFVRRPEDIEQLRALVPRSIKLIAKIEKDTALGNLCGILDAADAIMVARGDLGVELPFEEVPLMQKRIIREAGLARQAGHHRDPDARVDDARAAPHAGRGLRRRQRHPRRHRRRHALGRDGGRRVSARGGARDGPDRHGRWRCSARRAASRSTRPSGAAVAKATCAAPRGGDERAGADRGCDRRRRLRGRRDAVRAPHRLLHQQRLHRAEGGDLPSHRADLREHARAGDLPPALSGVGRDAGAHRSFHRLRLDAERGAPADPRARARAARRAAGGDGRRPLRHARALPTSSRSKQFRRCVSPFWARARRSACPRLV